MKNETFILYKKFYSYSSVRITDEEKIPLREGEYEALDSSIPFLYCK